MLSQKLKNFAKKLAVLALLLSKKNHLKLLGWFTRLPLLIIFLFAGDRSYRLFSNSKKDKRLKTRKTSCFSQLSLKLFFARAISGDKSTTAKQFAAILSNTKPTSEVQYELMNHFMISGRLDLAKEVAIHLIKMKPDKFILEKSLGIHRQTGIICFLLGQNQEANHYLRLAGEIRKSYRKPSTPTKYRILSPDWFVAIGHIATLDYYLKLKCLSSQNDLRIVAPPHENVGCASDMLRKFSTLGISVVSFNELPYDYDQWAKDNHEPRWHQLSDLEKEAITDNFWEYEFSDGTILGYSHATSRIQKKWEQSGLPPLLQVTQDEKNWLDAFLRKLGLPADAWFVCVHVRETGFHQKWNSIYPSMRDANIEDYYPAIQEIVNAGGWVLRMGDPSMRKIPPMHNVIDYAHSPHRTSLADLLLAASCRFFLGTNSGFATIPAIYGTPCALSNWVHIGWPLWPSQDLMICKLFREKATQRLLSLEEIFKQNLAFLQNWSDLPVSVELIDNSSDDIRQLTLEMLSCFGTNKRALQDIGAPKEFHTQYEELAKCYDTYVGSRFAGSFVKNYPKVFNFYKTEELTEAMENKDFERVLLN